MRPGTARRVSRSGFGRWVAPLGGILLAWLLGGCRSGTATGRPFRFPADVLAVTNETWWSYGTDPATGRSVHAPRVPRPTYALRCFVLARTAKQFHDHAEFRPDLAALEPAEERVRLRTLLRRNPRGRRVGEPPVVFQGYADLRTFSEARADWLRADAGGAWRSYLQRGNWRMLLPFTRRGQRREARRLATEVGAGRVAVVHLTEFPRLRLNHAVLLYAVAADGTGNLDFSAYDPNDPSRAVTVRFRSEDGRWRMPPVPYFGGGPVRAYEVYATPFR